MKKMKIEKQLIFADQIKRMISLEVQENLTYRHEEDGIRAMGPLFIQGEYEGAQGIQRFQETLEMDVLAPQSKLSGQPFSLVVKESTGEIKDNTVIVHITMDIYGLCEEEGKAEPNSMPSKEAAQMIEPPKQKDEMIETLPQQKNTPESSNNTVSEQAEAHVEDLNDLFADAESTYTSYRLIVAKPNDTYTAIANRYDVEENALRDCNRNKEILAKTLVLLPFEKK